MSPTHLSDAEWKVMNVLWASGPRTAREVLDQLDSGTDWAYSTVKTVLDRLEQKGIVGVDRSQRARRFRALISQHGARGHAVRGLLERAFEGTLGNLVQHLMGEGPLDPEERQVLERALRRAESEDQPEEPR